MIRPAAAIAVLAALAVFGIVELATGHGRSGLITLLIIGVLTIPTIAGRILRRRHSGGYARNMHNELRTVPPEFTDLAVVEECCAV